MEKFDCFGYDVKGYDVEGFDIQGFNQEGVMRPVSVNGDDFAEREGNDDYE